MSANATYPVKSHSKSNQDYQLDSLRHQRLQTGAESPSSYLIDSSSDELSSFASCMSHLSLKRDRSPNDTKDPSQPTHINVLPTEVLEHIFLHLSTISPCDSEQRWVPTRKARLIRLTHICPNWRHIAINLPILWSHIDITLGPEKTAHLTLAAARTFIERAGQSLFEIHVVAHSLLPAFKAETFRPVNGLLVSISHRIQRLNIWASNSLSSLRDVYQKQTPWNPTESILGACLAKAVGGAFTELSIANPGPSFLGLSGSRALSDKFISRSELESVTRHITIVNLHGAFFPWESPLYAGLVELKLRQGQSDKIDETQFTALLVSNPCLQVLELKLEIVESPDSPAPVLLEHLEVLVIEENAETVLRLLTLGVKLHRLSISYPYDNWGRPLGLFSNPATSTHITNSSQDFPPLLDLLHRTPNLKQLTLKSWPKPAECVSAELSLRTSIHLDSLCLGNCQLGLHDIVYLVTRIQVRKLIVWGNSKIIDFSLVSPSGMGASSTPKNLPLVSENLHLSFRRSSSFFKEPESATAKRVAVVSMAKDALITKLSQYVPVVKVLDGQQNPLDV